MVVRFVRLATFLFVWLAGPLLAAAGDLCASQLFSTRSEGLTPALTGLFPDDWSDAVLNPAALPGGNLVFARVDWAAEPSHSRRAVVGGRGALRATGWLAAGALETEGESPQFEHGLVAWRYGRGDAVGLRYAFFRPATRSATGHSLLGAYRTEAGDGWLLDMLGEATVVRSARSQNRYFGGEILLRQPGPERSLTAGGWRYRLIRLRGGVGTGNFGSGSQNEDGLHWLEGSVAHLHSRRFGDLTLGAGWAVRYTSFNIDLAPCALQCPAAEGASRRGLSLDGALEALALWRISLRAGGSWVVLARGDEPYAPRVWRANASLVPVRFTHGLWVGAGWQVHGGLSLDAALDAMAADDVAGTPPLTLQATYRF
jgi:hypothetical protein